jgi:glycosyltransferase involved in cell wall biosynthesis
MLTAHFPPHIGGAEIQARSLAAALRAKGIDVFVLTQHFRNLKKRETIDGICIRRLFVFGGGRLRSLVFMLSAFLFLLKKKKQYHIIHVHLASSPALTAVIARQILRKKVMVKFAGAGKTGDIASAQKTFIGKLKLKILRKYTDFFVCPSQEIQKELIDYKFPSTKIVTIPNGVDTKKFSPVGETVRKKIKESLTLPWDKLVTFAGRLEPGKGLEILLPAWQKVVTAYPDVHLLLLGEGSTGELLREKVSELGIERETSFPGAVQNVNEYLRASDIFILPSAAEGLSNALLEAMACGAPVIATHIGGTEEVIRDGVNGLLVEPENPEDLARAILTLLKDKAHARRLGRNARKTIETGYSLDRISQRYIQLYSQLMKVT